MRKIFDIALPTSMKGDALVLEHLRELSKDEKTYMIMITDIEDYLVNFMDSNTVMLSENIGELTLSSAFGKHSTVDYKQWREVIIPILIKRIVDTDNAIWWSSDCNEQLNALNRG